MLRSPYPKSRVLEEGWLRIKYHESKYRRLGGRVVTARSQIRGFGTSVGQRSNDGIEGLRLSDRDRASKARARIMRYELTDDEWTGAKRLATDGRRASAVG